MTGRLETNIQRVRKSVKDQQGRYSVRTRALARKLAAETRDNVKANIKPKGQGGVFPGYAMTGHLEGKAVASEATRSGNSWTARVRMLTTGKARRYALIHELGGTIRAKSGSYLRFKVRGSWVQVKQVRITRKLYFAKGVERTRREWTTQRLRREF